MMKKLAIPTREGMVDDHFGHCAYYTIVTLNEQNQVVNQERLDSPEGCGCKSNIATVMQEMGITLMLAVIIICESMILTSCSEGDNALVVTDDKPWTISTDDMDPTKLHIDER